MKNVVVKNFLVLLEASILFLAVSCAKHPPPQIRLTDFTPQAVIGAIKTKKSRVTSLRGLAKVKIETPKEKVRFKQVTIVKEPDIIYLEALGAFGNTLARLESNASTIELKLPRQRLIFDRRDEFNLSLLYPGMPATIGIEELTDLLLARLPDFSYPNLEDVELSADKGLLVINTPDSHSEEKLWIDPSNLTVVRANVRLDGDSMATYEFDHYIERVPGVLFPLHIKFKTAGFSISLKYDSDVEINSPEEGKGPSH